ncbi:chemotaxis protein CheW [Legionella longbeachae]|uniref:Putative chemotaxis signal transduction protein (CheW domain) n=1 Tax=Legionella longbeachae serogroup 1 (strain NSW150) TaxID=661367 RepID=D3HMR4_LEGLN|nr:chemotaxis protein CheW [Legionella longbeachae]VEE04265.1 chemotaxis signal transduction protein (cheW domain) [Legionella oakridgensis]HBD7397035.1 chemotaxis protein CheW [Legionella pneumophila]ARB92907.1 chemotaxis protein CheW [Legionella longbeachae]ARM33952.1 chemotaxis protein CheW [Legionella longbeachae]EEZ96842.1 putative chemotaxis protein CheW [Legionella longbeachae D-4968]
MTIKEQKHASELIPKSEEALYILQARTRQLAQQEVDKTQNNGIAFVHFTLNKNEHYGIPYQYVQEILHHVDLVKPPFIPHFIAGVINWRGALITVIDLIRFFHPHPSGHKQKNDFIIVINANNITLALLTPQIKGSAVYQPNQLAIPLSSTNAAKPEYILGLHHAVTAIIHVEALISSLCLEIKKSLYRRGEVHGNH